MLPVALSQPALTRACRSVVPRPVPHRPSFGRRCSRAAPPGTNRGRGYRRSRCSLRGGIGGLAVAPPTAGRGPHHAPLPSKAAEDRHRGGLEFGVPGWDLPVGVLGEGVDLVPRRVVAGGAEDGG